MKNLQRVVLLLSGSLVLGCLSLLGHHSLSSEFNLDRSLALTGVVTEVAWGNPHTWFRLDVRGSHDGKTSSWSLQLPSPNVLERLGWAKDVLKSGETVAVSGNPAKDGSRKGNVREIKLGDGRTLTALPK
jgi:Family of unknown function (DUF6152)